MKERYPAAANDRAHYKDPLGTSALCVSDKEVLKAIRSFPAGSSGGPDGLRPKHIIDLVCCKTVGHELLSALTCFINMLLDGRCHPDIMPVLFRGTLTALQKKAGGIQPIAVGYTWRHIAARCANTYAITKLADYFALFQLGVGVRCGCEAAVHATRRFVQRMPNYYVIAKLDFTNAFNSLHRDSMLEAVFQNIPEIYKFCHLAYGKASFLRYGSWTVVFEEGTQQGDTLGPLLFCLTIQPLLSSLDSELVIGYIDDITLGGSFSSVHNDVVLIKSRGLNAGCVLNINKCELISPSPCSCSQSPILSQFIQLKPDESILLGAPLLSGPALDNTLTKKFNEMSRLSVNLRLISSHDALIVLKYALSTPRILHLLRGSPCYGHSVIGDIDRLLRSNVSYIANVDPTDQQWTQASLSIRDGGLGIRRASALALSAFLSSAANKSVL